MVQPVPGEREVFQPFQQQAREVAREREQQEQEQAEPVEARPEPQRPAEPREVRQEQNPNLTTTEAGRTEEEEREPPPQRYGIPTPPEPSIDLFA
jgi:hypothetical protein